MKTLVLMQNLQSGHGGHDVNVEPSVDVVDARHSLLLRLVQPARTWLILDQCGKDVDLLRHGLPGSLTLKIALAAHAGRRLGRAACVMREWNAQVEPDAGHVQLAGQQRLEREMNLREVEIQSCILQLHSLCWCVKQQRLLQLSSLLLAEADEQSSR